MIVMKFGGVSIQDASSIDRITKIVLKRLPLKPLVVISAMGKTTKNLLTAATFSAQGRIKEAVDILDLIKKYHFHILQGLLPDFKNSRSNYQLTTYFTELRKLLDGMSILQDFSPRSQDKLLSYGELISTAIITDYFQKCKIKAKWMDAREFIITDERFTQAKPIEEIAYQKIIEYIRPVLKTGLVPVIQGYIGATQGGATSTLGFEGSDLTASLVGAALDADDIQIFKDVPGIMTADPEIFPKPLIVKKITFSEVADLTFLGAKVLHPMAIEPAFKKNIPVHVVYSKNPNAPGTEISKNSVHSNSLVKSIAYKRPLCILKVQSHRSYPVGYFLKEVFDALDKERIIPYVVAITESNVSLAIHASEHVENLVKDLTTFGAIQIQYGKATISLVGENLSSAGDVGTTILQALKDIDVNMIIRGISSINFTLVIDEDMVSEVVSRLHRVFFNHSEKQ